ncbi:hypothetical protein [Streptococcus suis]|uniref:hypothetical protein n=1 Tax=Streptococcus suis TaxID=1307 RepID=UPI0023D7BD44|nr:hypothetical protein M8286_01245 [Streptococcus suis]
MYTKNDALTQTSHIVIGGLNLDEGALFEVDLGESYIISADTSGFFLSDDSIFVSCGEIVFNINANSGSILWEQRTWRLVLKRALSSPATTLEEFIINEEGIE